VDHINSEVKSRNSTKGINRGDSQPKNPADPFKIVGKLNKVNCTTDEAKIQWTVPMQVITNNCIRQNTDMKLNTNVK